MKLNRWRKKGIPERDISGKCNGCRDRVREGEESRQKLIESSGIESREYSESRRHAYLHNEPPGVWGGHM